MKKFASSSLAAQNFLSVLSIWYLTAGIGAILMSEVLFNIDRLAPLFLIAYSGLALVMANLSPNRFIELGNPADYHLFIIGVIAVVLGVLAIKALKRTQSSGWVRFLYALAYISIVIQLDNLFILIRTPHGEEATYLFISGLSVIAGAVITLFQFLSVNKLRRTAE